MIINIDNNIDNNERRVESEYTLASEQSSDQFVVKFDFNGGENDNENNFNINFNNNDDFATDWNISLDQNNENEMM